MSTGELSWTSRMGSGSGITLARTVSRRTSFKMFTYSIPRQIRWLREKLRINKQIILCAQNFWILLVSYRFTTLIFIIIMKSYSEKIFSHCECIPGTTVWIRLTSHFLIDSNHFSSTIIAHPAKYGSADWINIENKYFKIETVFQLIINETNYFVRYVSCGKFSNKICVPQSFKIFTLFDTVVC